MRVDLDGHLLELPRPTLADALRVGITEADRRGVVIVTVLADGKPLQGPELEQPSEEPSPYQTISFLAATPASLVERSLRDAASAVQEIGTLQPRVVELINAGQTQQGLEELQSIFATWSAVRDVVERGGRLLRQDFLAIDLPGIDAKTPVQACMNGLSSSLVQIKLALSNQDWSLLSDVVGYELDGLARDWNMVLGALADQVARSSPGEWKEP
ncbi:MAG: hypothetical protein NTV94_01600 [Planctomycetota bacterium]|nr:hypothetical protein [Planctomycetota bacterium]